MNYNIKYTTAFKKELKRLSKKYPSIKNEYKQLLDQLQQNPELGTSIGNECFKIRIAIKSKKKGKSGGARAITHIKIVNNDIYLLFIYDKADRNSISNKEIENLMKSI